MRPQRLWRSIPLTLLIAMATSAQSALIVQNENVSLSLESQVGEGIAISSIQDQVTHHEYLARDLTRPTPLFEFAVKDGTPQQSDSGIEVTQIASGAGGSLVINARARNEPLTFVITVSADGGESAAVVRFAVKNTGEASVFLRMVVPKIRGLVAPGDPAKTMGAVPQEIGSVVPLKGRPPLGMFFNIGIGLPKAMNTMELASIYDPAGGGGIFFAGISGKCDR